MGKTTENIVSKIDSLSLEEEYIGLILTTKYAKDYISVRPEWLENESLSRILSIILEIKKESKPLTQIEVTEKLKNDTDKFYYSESIGSYPAISSEDEEEIETVMEIYEKRIIDEYKNKLALALEEKKNKNEISLTDYFEKIEQLKAIEVARVNSNSILNISEINLEEKKEEKVLFKIKKLDEMTKGFSMGQLSVWSGSNGGAKSTFLNQLAIECVEQGYKTLIYSGELSSERLLGWIMRQCAGKKNMRWNEEFTECYVPVETKQKIAKWLNQKMYIYNNTNGFKAEYIIQNILKSIKKDGVKVIFIDNLMSLDISGYTANKYDAQGSFIQELVGIAQKYQVHIHFVCHPRKVTSFLRKVDISGSGDLTNMADNVFILHRVNNDFKKSASEFYNPATISELSKYGNIIEICKFRDDGSAVDKLIGMYFDVQSKRMMNTPDEEKHYGWEKL